MTAISTRTAPSRLAALRRLLILDSSADVAYDDLTRLLASTLEVPVALVNLLDEDRDWFKSVVGLPYNESPAVTSFCGAFFNSSKDLIVVEDTTADRTFAAHPLVVNAPFVRFYAGARLAVAGHTLGTLCAYDVTPRRISAAQVQELQTLASAATELLQRRASTFL